VRRPTLSESRDHWRRGFLDYWEGTLDGKLHSVRVASAQLIKPGRFRYARHLRDLH
jgi:uncharacterized protein Usg